ncbi:MAG: ABC transporter permease subunit [Gammaproteobacteria bacterium]
MSYISITEQNWQRRKRALIDKIAHHSIGLGGVSIIFAIVLIFFYLLWVVAPIFSSPEVTQLAQYQLETEDGAKTMYLGVEESGHLGLRISSAGQLQFFDLEKGDTVSTEQLELPEYSSIIAIDELDIEGKQLLLALDNGRVLFVSISYLVNFVADERTLEPIVNTVFGEEPLELNYLANIALITATKVDDELVLAAMASDGQLLLQRLYAEDEDEDAEPVSEALLEIPFAASYMLLDPLGEWLYLADKQGQIIYYNISDLDDVQLVDQMILVEPGRQLVTVKMLLGGVSIITADDLGWVQQWTLQRDEKNQYQLKEVRGYQAEKAVTQLLPEKRRKGLLSLDQDGHLQIYHTTADKLLYQEALIDYSPRLVALSSRANRLLINSDNEQYHLYKIDNPHPELSWSSLWGEVTYEGYTEPKYIWQSSSADNDFEPKFSLAPLAFGTLKAAFYAMLVAIPLAIMGAIYTAYFMAPKMRSWVKPSIEIMEALPTVILGFLAGLWFAPLVEDNLLAILSLVMVLPVGLILFALLWTSLPKQIRYLVPEGWQAALLIPVIILLVWFSFAVAPAFEQVLFDGNLRLWMKQTLGIGYDQRNSLVVGIAMGIAVIPTIFSITEDAIFSVPKILTNGSLALGATPWQTLTRVVLLTASPGIFSAVMIGFGRAVGETMIVLMATGNTPIMDMSIFEGMRTLSANIAVELPESEVDSTHYRILFLAALVLFLVTFIFNTVAEVVRQRLRKRYSSL